MVVPWLLIVSALGGPLPATVETSIRPVELVDDGPALFTGWATAGEPSLQNSGRAGPVRTGDLNPLHTGFLSLAPERPEVLRKGQVALNLNVARTNSMEGYKPEAGGSGLLHAETVRTELNARLGLGHGLEASVALPWVERHEPLMDEFIGWVERASWMQKMMPSRELYQGTSPEFSQYVPDQGMVASAITAGGAGDATLQLKGKLTNEGRYLPALSLRLGAKLPTGDWARGFGSGTPDVAVGLSVEKALFSWLTVYGSVVGTLPFSQSAYVRPFGMASLAVEGIISSALSATLQFNTATSPYRGTGIGVLDGRDDLWILSANYRAAWGDSTFRFSLFAVENVCLFLGEPWSGSANDFTIGFNLSIEPLARAF
jgi:hypothetical protein